MSDYTDTIDYYAALAAQHEGKCVYHGPATEKDAAPPELSPAARAVLTAVTLTKYDVPPEGLPAFAEEMAPLIAAALRAAADQVVPLQLPPETAVDANHPTVEWHVWNAEQQSRFALFVIANELEAQ